MQKVAAVQQAQQEFYKQAAGTADVAKQLKELKSVGKFIAGNPNATETGLRDAREFRYLTDMAAGEDVMGALEAQKALEYGNTLGAKHPGALSRLMSSFAAPFRDAKLYKDSDTLSNLAMANAVTGGKTANDLKLLMGTGAAGLTGLGAAAGYGINEALQPPDPTFWEKVKGLFKSSSIEKQANIIAYLAMDED